VISDSRPLPPPPSWPHLTATTLRLWVQRHLIPARPNARARSEHLPAFQDVQLSPLLNDFCGAQRALTATGP
jgi:hypothetical protein